MPEKKTAKPKTEKLEKRNAPVAQPIWPKQPK
jgi:hypothetical protein